MISQPFCSDYLTVDRIVRAPKLKLAITAGAGADMSTWRAATERGLTIAEVTFSHSISVSEHVVIMILSLVRRYLPSHARARQGDGHLRLLDMQGHSGGRYPPSRSEAHRRRSGGRHHIPCQAVERALRLRDRRRGHLRIARRGREVTVTKQHLDHPEIGPVLKPVGCEAVSECVDADALGKAGRLRRGPAGGMKHLDVDRLVSASGEQSRLGPRQ